MFREGVRTEVHGSYPLNCLPGSCCSDSRGAINDAEKGIIVDIDKSQSTKDLDGMKLAIV